MPTKDLNKQFAGKWLLQQHYGSTILSKVNSVTTGDGEWCIAKLDVQFTFTVDDDTITLCKRIQDNMDGASIPMEMDLNPTSENYHILNNREARKILANYAKTLATV